MQYPEILSTTIVQSTRKHLILLNMSKNYLNDNDVCQQCAVYLIQW